ncbi:MAG: NAD(P)-dependent oxidoreductase [Deltaproteobacteria bacterium]|nr:NAD(P)-dependent oxidoreductase [Deltaproteobacteria bacterium]
MKTVALLHPGNMGVTIGAAAATSGARVVWASQQRSEATHDRARRAGLVDVETLTNAVRASDIILSVCPPHAALELARSVAEHKFSGIYVDANAVSRATAEQIGEIVTKAGASFVDGGIIGSPVKRAGTTRLYLSGARASEVADLFSGSMLDARAIGEKPGAASALKIAYAAWTKCTDALVLAVRALAAREGVDKALLEEWSLSQPDLERRSTQAAAIAAPKAWRYVGEMREIAATFEAAGLPAGFHRAAADLYERLVPFKDCWNPPLTVTAVVDRLCASSEKRREAFSE